MAFYRFTFDPNGTPTVVSDPINWIESNIQIKRDDEIKGIFAEYIADLKWVGSAFTYLMNVLSTNGICSDVDVLIEYKQDFLNDDTFETLFNGKIRLRDIKIDRQKDIATATIVDQTLSSIIKERIEYKCYSAEVKSVSGTSITAPTSKPTKLFSPMEQTRSVYLDDVRAYAVNDMFEFILDYITDDQVAFDSDFFSVSGSSSEVWKLELDENPIAAKEYTLSITNQFGTISVSQVANGSIDNTKRKLITALTEQMVREFSLSPNYSKWDGTNPYCAVYGNFRDGNSFTNDGDSVYLASLWELSAVTLTSGTTTKVASLDSNMSELHITTGEMIWEMKDTSADSRDIEFFLSFRDLFNACNYHFDLTFTLTDVGGTPTMKLERTESLFDPAAAASVTITGVTDIQESFTMKYKKSGIVLGGRDVEIVNDLIDSNNSDYWTDVGIDKPTSMRVVNDCGDGNENIVPTFRGATKDFARILLDEVDDNGTPRPPSDFNKDIFFLDIYEDTSLYYAKKYSYFSNERLPTGDQFFTGYNFHLGSFKSIDNWVFSLGDGVRSGQLIIPNNNSLVFSRMFEFSVPLSDVDWQAIINNLTDKITFSGQGVAATDGWIDEIDVDVKNGIINFKLLAE